MPARGNARRRNAYPTKPIRLLVPFTPGGSQDVMARLVSIPVTQSLGRNIVVDNRPGAGGLIATQEVARANNDGYTLLLSSGAQMSIAPALHADVGYDPIRSFAHVIHVIDAPLVLIAHPAFPPGSVKELIAYSKSNAGKVNTASTGNGTYTHLTLELFKIQTGADLTHIPYKGAAPAIADLLSRQVQTMFTQTASAQPYTSNNRLKALGVTAPKRAAAMPDVPTFMRTRRQTERLGMGRHIDACRHAASDRRAAGERIRRRPPAARREGAARRTRPGSERHVRVTPSRGSSARTSRCGRRRSKPRASSSTDVTDAAAVRVGIIGAGPIGRATAAYLAHHGHTAGIWSPSGASLAALSGATARTASGSRTRARWSGSVSLERIAKASTLAEYRSGRSSHCQGHAYPAVLPGVADVLRRDQLIIVERRALRSRRSRIRAAHGRTRSEPAVVAAMGHDARHRRGERRPRT